MSLFDVIGNVFGNMAKNAGGMAIDGAFQFCKGAFSAIRKNLIKNNYDIVEDITPERAEEIRDELALNIIERSILTKILQVKINIDYQPLVLLAQNLANLITNHITNDVRFLGNPEYRRCIVDIVSEKLIPFIKINEAQCLGIIGPSLSLTDPAGVAKTIKQITKNIRNYVTSDIKKLLDVSDDCSEMRILLAAEKDSRKTREIVNKLTNLNLVNIGFINHFIGPSIIMVKLIIKKLLLRDCWQVKKIMVLVRVLISEVIILLLCIKQYVEKMKNQYCCF